MTDDVIKAVLDDVAIDRLNAETFDTILTHYNLENLPTGSLIVTLGSVLRLLYHSNDLNCHCGLLVWCSYDGEDSLSLYYEPGKTRPLLVELDVMVNQDKQVVLFNQLNDMVRSRDYAYKPRQEVIDNPRYLQSIEDIIHVLPYVHFSNDAHYGFKHKWQPKIWTKPELNGYVDAREYCTQLQGEYNPLAFALRRKRTVSATCADVMMTMISLLHESLFINLTPEEIAKGIVPAPNKILINTDDYDVSRLVSPNSEMYKIYEPTSPLLTMRAIHTHPRTFAAYDFFFPFIVGILVFIFIFAFIKPLTHLIFGTKSLIKELVEYSS